MGSVLSRAAGQNHRVRRSRLLFDLIARVIADKLSAKLKQTFIVENRPGAAGNLGAAAVANAVPDGHTLLVALGTTFTVNPSVYKSLPYDPERDFGQSRSWQRAAPCWSYIRPYR